MGKAYGGKSQEVERLTQFSVKKNPHQIKNRLKKVVKKYKSIMLFFIQHYSCSSLSLVLWNEMSLKMFLKIWNRKTWNFKSAWCLCPFKSLFSAFNLILIPSEQGSNVLISVNVNNPSQLWKHGHSINLLQIPVESSLTFGKRDNPLALQ